MNCITCKQQLPADTKEHPRYFSQYRLNPTSDDFDCFGEELSQLLNYAEAVLTAMPEFRKDEDVLIQLNWLVKDLVLEAQQRLELLVDAAELWEQRAKAKKEGSHGA